MKNRRLFISIFAMSLAVTLLVSPVKVFNNPVVDTIQVQAEDEPITDTQRGVALLMTIILSQGLRFVGDWNTVVQPGLTKLWEDFSTATGNAVTLPMIVAGSSLALGYIRTSNTVNNAIANFMAWYKQTFSQPNTGDVNITIPGDTPYISASSSAFVVGVATSNENFIFKGEGSRGVLVSANDGYFFCALGPLGSTYFFGAYNGNPKNITGNSLFAGRYNGTVIRGDYGPALLSSVSSLTPVLSFDGNFNTGGNLPWVFNHVYSGSTIGDISMEGQSLDLKDGYQLESDQAKLYDIAGLEALVASLALTLENIDDLVRDIPLIFDTPWAEDFPDVPAYVDTPDDTIPWVDVPDSVIPADIPEYVPTIPSERDEYKVLGLDQVFPFSIPFDFYYLSQILVSEPETPEFQYAAVNPVNGNLLTIDVDLHDFDGVASIFRTCETVLFIAFLIWITRFLIRS